MVLDYFGITQGTFLDIGSNDGETLSNTRALSILGWSGVCAEPDPTAFRRLLELYGGSSEVFCYPFAIGTETGKAKFFSSGTHLGNGDTGLLSTLKESESERWTVEKFEETEVDVLTWKHFYELIPFRTFEFVNIDAEGVDVEILEQMDLEEMGVQLICIEFNSVLERRERIERHIGEGWRVEYVNAENLIYAKA